MIKQATCSRYAKARGNKDEKGDGWEQGHLQHGGDVQEVIDVGCGAVLVTARWRQRENVAGYFGRSRQRGVLKICFRLAPD